MSKYEFVAFLIYIGIAIGCIALSIWLFNIIMASDMPDWLKYLLLR